MPSEELSVIDVRSAARTPSGPPICACIISFIKNYCAVLVGGTLSYSRDELCSKLKQRCIITQIYSYATARTGEQISAKSCK